MLNVLAVFMGGGLGSLCHYGLGFPSGTFPWATLAANVLACGLLGAVLGASQQGQMTTSWRLLLGTGFCGGFSTFSTFVGEGQHLAQTWSIGGALGYGGLSLCSGWLAFTTGWWCAQQWSP